MELPFTLILLAISNPLIGTQKTSYASNILTTVCLISSYLSLDSLILGSVRWELLN